MSAPKVPSRALLAVLLLACRHATPKLTDADSTANWRDTASYGYIVLSPSAHGYGFLGDTLPELRTSQVPYALRAAADRYSTSADRRDDAFNKPCTRYFGRRPPYLVLFVGECPVGGMVTDNTSIEMFVPNGRGGFRFYVPRESPWTEVEPPWRDANGKGGGVGIK